MFDVQRRYRSDCRGSWPTTSGTGGTIVEKVLFRFSRSRHRSKKGTHHNLQAITGEKNSACLLYRDDLSQNASARVSLLHKVALSKHLVWSLYQARSLWQRNDEACIICSRFFVLHLFRAVVHLSGRFWPGRCDHDVRSHSFDRRFVKQKTLYCNIDSGLPRSSCEIHSRAFSSSRHRENSFSSSVELVPEFTAKRWTVSCAMMENLTLDTFCS